VVMRVGSATHARVVLTSVLPRNSPIYDRRAAPTEKRPASGISPIGRLTAALCDEERRSGLHGHVCVAREQTLDLVSRPFDVLSTVRKWFGV
jgi:hypothetical protein